MIDENKLKYLIDIALVEIQEYAVKSKIDSIDEAPISKFIKVLRLLKIEAENNPNQINERVLRAIRDVGGIIVKSYDDASFEEPFFKVFSFLSKEITYFDNLEPLRNDFGRGDPI